MDQPLVKNAADVSQIKDAKRKEKNKVWRDKENLQAILNMKSGRAILWKYLCECGLFKTSYVSEGSEIYFLEGQRNIGLSIMNDINEVDPDSYLKMMKENK